MAKGGQNTIDITGKRFGRLSVIDRSPRLTGTHAAWRCICDCGKEINVISTSLRRGHTQSCGCWHYERQQSVPYKHGLGKIPEYSVWSSMIRRCTDPKHKGYFNYGGRGIKVCDRWLDIENFYADMGPRPTGKIRYTLERVDFNGDYCPENCIWDTYLNQGSNRRNSVILEAFGEKHIASEWSRRLGITEYFIRGVAKRGESLERLIADHGVTYGQ